MLGGHQNSHRCSEGTMITNQSLLVFMDKPSKLSTPGSPSVTAEGFGDGLDLVAVARHAKIMSCWLPGLVEGGRPSTLFPVPPPALSSEGIQLHFDSDDPPPPGGVGGSRQTGSGGGVWAVWPKAHVWVWPAATDIFLRKCPQMARLEGVPRAWWVGGGTPMGGLKQQPGRGAVCSRCSFLPE